MGYLSATRSRIQTSLFPFLEEELGPQDERKQQFVRILKPTRIERQKTLPLKEMLEGLSLPRDRGTKTNSKGYKESYKLHIDVADGQIPISCTLMSASYNDSLVALLLATRTNT
ncbi:MAG: hypothetical protein B1H02_00580, partial [Candidatus Latescibacteria bacterium 4484_107]